MPARKGLQGLSVGELAARSGVAISALHFYEAQGLIRSWRTPGNQRRYARDCLRRVALIRISQSVGISLARIGEALRLLPDGRTPTAEDWQRLSADWHAELTVQIQQLQKLRDDLLECVGCGCLSFARCHLVNGQDKLAREGAGPRRIFNVPEV